MSTIEELQKLSEREDHVEFKKAEHNYGLMLQPFP